MDNHNTHLSHIKRGYLNTDFSFFSLEDTQAMQIESHYHDFNKIVIFISGQVTYCIEGTAYKLRPWDILLINRNTIHKPVIDATSPYRRMIIWFQPSFLQKYTNPNYDLLTCFELADRHKCNLLRMTPEMLTMIQSLLFQINGACQNRSFGDELLRSSLFLQFLVYLNRMALEIKKDAAPAGMESDETIGKILYYIDNHVAEDLSIERLASLFFLSKYHLMRKFKHHTGYSIHNYVLQKRLINASQFLRAGQSATAACLESGFHDYANFTRAFKKTYGLTPTQYQKLPEYE
ncbi:Hypothetical protein LUCI_0204 [Lucifera butyrica]|uniref:HTH araC/xylS-type domain-containing protein n=1 Tax=Lucifera butyrica TaxID=1351585 RepID=A0A498R786_9FIRM|nr:AraC family transcriptional regulator [Lucifera butyrica]VBB04998.1 Hypothetical protein LUCI_0204 [Lucifera butyrica]